MTGPELKKLREHLGDAIGRKLTVADMAKLCGLPEEGGASTIRKWEVSGQIGPVAELLRILAMASDHYPILEPRPPAGLPRADARRRTAADWLSQACRGDWKLSLSSALIRPLLSTKNVYPPMGWVATHCVRRVTAFYSKAV